MGKASEMGQLSLFKPFCGEVEEAPQNGGRGEQLAHSQVRVSGQGDNQNVHLRMARTRPSSCGVVRGRPSVVLSE